MLRVPRRAHLTSRCPGAHLQGVIRYHGPRPSVRTNQVFVANHTSMIDFIILEQTTPFAVIMQKHGGWVGWMQSTVLSSLGCIHFNRSESKDRALVAQKCGSSWPDPSLFSSQPHACTAQRVFTDARPPCTAQNQGARHHARPQPAPHLSRGVLCE